MLLGVRDLWSEAPPDPRDAKSNWPTVLYSWWATAFAAVIIIIRLFGRKTRSNQLFREDWIMMISLIPLFARMVLIHFVLIYGTNNVATEGHTYTEQEIWKRSIGSRLVLAARICYALFIWLSKLTVSEFLKRITIRIWRRSYEYTLQGIRIFLVVTFGIVVIATLAECQPFHHYWQVVPDPGAHCRQGFAQLLTMGISDIITDLLLIGFPIPVVLNSGQSWKRKIQMGALFSLSIIMIAVTATRMPQVISHHGRQQYRTVWASCEILASAAVSNAVILGSFLRDKGTKKNRYRTHSIADSLERTSTRRPTLVALEQSGSDEDLFRSLGFAIPEHLQDKSDTVARPAPPAFSSTLSPKRSHAVANIDTRHDGRSSDSDDSLRKPPIDTSLPSPAPSTNRSVSFFDVGGLLENGRQSPSSRSQSTTAAEPGVAAQDFASPSPVQSRRGSRSHLYELGGNWSPATARDSRSYNYSARRQSDSEQGRVRARTAPIGVLGPRLERHETQQSLQDAGGLLQTILDLPAGEHDTVAGATLDRIPRQHQAHEPPSLYESGGTTATTSQRVTARRNERQTSPLATRRPQQMPSSPDDLVLHDPGGLARQ